MDSKPKILFVHPTYPSQYGGYVRHFLQKGYSVYFLARSAAEKPIAAQNFRLALYQVKPQTVLENNSTTLAQKLLFQFSLHADSAREAMLSLNKSGLNPDVIFSFSGFGSSLCVREVFPKAKILTHVEWYYGSENSDLGFLPEEPATDEVKSALFARNMPIVFDIENSDHCVTATQWQRKQFPEKIRNKVQVQHEGVDFNFFTPSENGMQFRNPLLQSLIKANSQIITYTTRGYEAYRGFDRFIPAVKEVLKNNPRAQVVCAGADQIFYGNQSRKENFDSFRQKVLSENRDLDLSRVHFLNPMPIQEYRELLQASSVHYYSSVPFILSWSLLEAMACGTPVCASNTAPVQEFLESGKQGLLFDFFDVQDAANKIEELLNDPERAKSLGQAARKKVSSVADRKQACEAIEKTMLTLLG